MSMVEHVLGNQDVKPLNLCKEGSLPPVRPSRTDWAKCANMCELKSNWIMLVMKINYPVWADTNT